METKDRISFYNHAADICMAMWTMSVLLLTAIIMTDFARPLTLLAVLFAAGSVLVFAGFMAAKHQWQQVCFDDVHRFIYMAIVAAAMYCIYLDFPTSFEQIARVIKFFFYIVTLITAPYLLMRLLLKIVLWFKPLFKAA